MGMQNTKFCTFSNSVNFDSEVLVIHNRILHGLKNNFKLPFCVPESPHYFTLQNA